MGPKDTRPCLGMCPSILNPGLYNTLPGWAAPCVKLCCHLWRELHLHTLADVTLAQLCCFSQADVPWLPFLKLVLCSFSGKSLPDLLCVPPCGIPFPLLHFFCLCLIVSILNNCHLCINSFVSWPLAAKVGKLWVSPEFCVCMSSIITRVPVCSPECPSLDDNLQDYSTYKALLTLWWSGDGSLCSHLHLYTGKTSFWMSSMISVTP